ncbi:MAG TPA: CDP-alcohol phosphatidyltransferase family protein [Herpetosiphonaceae bacterium]
MSGPQIMTLPNLLTALRLLLVPVLWLCALLGRPAWIGAGLLAALLTDVLDGATARWLGQATSFGAALDSLADKLLTLSVVGWLALLFPEIFAEHPLLIGLAAAGLIGSWLTGRIKPGWLPKLHLWSARVGGGLQGLFALHTFLAGRYSAALLYLALGVGLLAALEEIAVQLVHPCPDEHIRTVFERPIRARIGAAVQRWLADRRLPLLLAGLAIGLTLPALRTGWHFDDYLHRAALGTGQPSLRAALDELFVFMDGDPERTRRLMDSGVFPWWALPQGQNAFWRPLAGLTHWLDYRLWPRSPLLMHTHSLLWFGALAAVAALLYRRLIGATWIAGLAALLYALDDARGYAASWIANRNALLATLCGCLALIAHDRWRRDGWRWGVITGPLALLLGLLSAEAATATLAYLLAYAIVLDRGGRRQRLGSLLPALLTTIGWRLGYRALGYGALGTSYVDPATEPLRFLMAVIERGPVLLLAQWALPPAELYPFLTPPASWLLCLCALAILAPLGFVAWPLLHRDVLARFWTLGMILAVVPACAALPANRLLGFVGLGTMGLLARLLIELWQAARSWRRALGLVLGAIHLLLAPLLLPLAAYSPALFGAVEPSIRSLPHDPLLARQTAIFVNAPSFFSISYLPIIRQMQGLPAPLRVRFLSSGPDSVELTRADAHTLLVRPAGGYLVGFDTVFRERARRFMAGQQIRLTDATVTVERLTGDGRPAEVAFRFDAPLESGALRWFAWRDGGYVAFTPPPPGTTIRLPSSLP